MDRWYVSLDPPAKRYPEVTEDGMAFWWCLEHKQVEEHLGCGSTTRIGPYDTQAQAADALKRIGQREDEQQKKDVEERKKWGEKTWL